MPGIEEDGLTHEQAFRRMTIWLAKVPFEENEKGHLTLVNGPALLF